MFGAGHFRVHHAIIIMEQLATVTKIAIFASGQGTNTQKIIDHFRGNQTVEVALIATNNPQAGVREIAAKEKIPVVIIEKERWKPMPA